MPLPVQVFNFQGPVEPMQIDADPQEDQQNAPDINFVVENPTLDLEQYASSYSGFMRIERLQFIAEHCPQLRVEALKMALSFVQRTFNVDSYEEVHRKLAEATREAPGEAEAAAEGAVVPPPLDTAWAESTRKKALLKLEKLDTDLKNYKGNSIKESIRLGFQLDTQDDHGFPMTQTRALQLLFDLRYLCSTLSPRPEGGQGGGSSQDPRIQQVCDWLEGFIDPFDLDVFTAPLSAHLNRLSQRTSVLLGFLTDTEKQFVQRNSAASSQEQYNILPLASSQIRFGLLPLSMSNTRLTKSGRQAVDPVSRATPTNSAIDHSFRPGNLFRQLAHHEEEPAAPSLFKFSWLSGMAK